MKYIFIATQPFPDDFQTRVQHTIPMTKVYIPCIDVWMSLRHFEYFHDIVELF